MTDTPLEIEFISHATLKIHGEFGTMLCDPWILNEPIYNLSTWKFPAARIPPQEVVAGVDWLFITHSHEDHFHIPSLDYFPRDIPILTPSYDEHPSLRAHTIERTLRKLGFHNIRRMDSWETVALGPRTRLTRVPSAGTRDHDWENSGFVLEHPDCTLLNVNDNVNDEALCRDIIKRFPKIDIAFIQSGGVTMFPGCFKLTEEEMREWAAKRKTAFLDQRRLMDFIKPDRIAPFAGDFCWLDDKYFHNNWANRTTLSLFREMLDTDYADSGVELVELLPTDRWTMKGGVNRNHPPVDWSDFLGEVQKVKDALQPKVDAIAGFLDDISYEDFEARSRARCAVVQREITRDYIDFDSRFRFAIEGPHSDFSFVMRANAETGLVFDWDDDAPVLQTLHVPENVWGAILEGKLMWNIIQWVGRADQHVPFNRDIGRFWFWFEYHVDLNAKNIQAQLEPQLIPGLSDPIRPQYATFPLPNEWALWDTRQRLAAAE